jgi:stage IV sporulation protein FB
MLLGEPTRTPYDINFSLFGVPIRIHPLFWLAAIITNYQDWAPPVVFAWIAAFFVSMLVHEFGHAFAMRRFGYRPWIVLFVFGGMTSYDFASDYRARRYDWLEHIAISAAGPAMGLLGVGALIAAIFALGHGGELVLCGPGYLIPQLPLLPTSRSALFLSLFVNDLLFIGVFATVINLFAIYPLDGGQIARELFLKWRVRDGIRNSLLLSIVITTLMTLYGIELKSWFLIIFFGGLAYENYRMLRSYADAR